MVHIAADLPQFLQRRELAAYEQRLARTAYAYGVDLRRSQWLSGSTVGDPLMRAVDRRWSRLVEDLDGQCLRPLRVAPPTALLEELAYLIHMLRAPLPTLRLLRSEVAAQWPMVTPLGTTKGGIHWLVLDLDRIMALPSEERTFALAAGLAHLQCEHGPIFSAHLMAHHGRGMGMIRGLLRPWAKVTVFSADRAGLVAVRELSVALRAIERHDAEYAAWMPRLPRLELRRQALEDFDRSTLMARRRVLSDADGYGWAIAPPGREEELDSVSRKVAAAVDGAIRLGGRLALRIEGYERRARDDERTDPDQEAKDAEGARDGEKAKDEDDRGAKRAAKSEPEPKAEAKAEAKPENGQEAKAAPSIDPERASRLEQALRAAWSLARCDQRLTRRLGLL
ncbi:M48 family metalloprotease [Paraliomyxa miuraensis]|uniref:hypothetical protein n=1 Tax=Paraliomyxa miuraensis TaxID=376150 RepID=UPI0022577C85|nr:hypothetical protein [Paraliomyxa miuraensis]MCX4244053.1 hypothetical protein [Paraliomyxa miuraensis]